MTRRPHVLLVEDEENVAYVVALALRHSGFEVAVVGTGAEALTISLVRLRCRTSSCST